jgi:hypothetical protein
MMIKIDDRTPEQRKTHIYAIVGNDTFLSYKGESKNGISKVAWATDNYRYVDSIENWVNSRSDVKYVNFVHLDSYRPSRNVAHFHIYVIDENHPALNKEGKQ